MRKIKYIAVHCTAGFGNLASIMAFWRNVKNWRYPGYHHIIDTDGTDHHIWPYALISNGVAGYNDETIHLSYIGGVDPDNYAIAKDTRTVDQKIAIPMVIRKILEEVKKHQPIDDIIIQGHRDFSPDQNGNGKIESWERIKECPSFDAKPEYAWIIKNVL